MHPNAKDYLIVRVVAGQPRLEFVKVALIIGYQKVEAGCLIATIRTATLKFAFEAGLGLAQRQHSKPCALRLAPPTTRNSNDPDQLDLSGQPSIASAVNGECAGPAQVAFVAIVGTRIGYVLPIAGTVAKATLSRPNSLTVSKVVLSAFGSPR